MQACWCYRQPSQLHTRDLLQACWRCAVHMSKHEVLYLQEQFSCPKAFEGERFWTCICFVVVHSAAANMRTNTLGSEPSIKDSSRPRAVIRRPTMKRYHDRCLKAQAAQASNVWKP